MDFNGHRFLPHSNDSGSILQYRAFVVSNPPEGGPIGAGTESRDVRLMLGLDQNGLGNTHDSFSIDSPFSARHHQSNTTPAALRVFAKSRISSNDWLKSSQLAHVFGRFLDPLLKSSSLELKKRLKIAEVSLTA